MLEIHELSFLDCRTDYVRHPIGKPFLHMPDRYVQPDGDMDHMTSYKKDYIREFMPFIPDSEEQLCEITSDPK